MNEQRTLLKAIERLQAMYDCNHEVMDLDDCEDLLNTISSLKDLYHSNYKKQVSQFIKYLEEPINNIRLKDDFWKKWTEQPYTITHGSMTVVIGNYADFYDGLLNLLKDHLNDLQ